ncbi:MAG TPA: SDR family oxidoreductase [Solimonas sp.]|nr:SDR family oxidoreductase [Solimonas sp.]
MYALNSKIAVVTGAGSGIGRALAQRLAAKGCRLALADINEVGLAETAALLPQPPLMQRLDVADRAAVYSFAERVQRELGAAHVVINNAGVAVSQTIVNLSYEDFEWLMGINFWGVVYGTKAFLPGMLAQNEGAMVNISSVFGLFAWPAQGSYNAAKFAVRGFTECLRHELTGTNVKATSVHPGGIRTNIVRNARMHVDHEGRVDRKVMEDDFQRLARTTAERAAEIIVDAIERQKPRVLVGPDAVLMDKIVRLLPESYYRVLNWLAQRAR